MARCGTQVLDLLIWGFTLQILVGDVDTSPELLVQAIQSISESKNVATVLSGLKMHRFSDQGGISSLTFSRRYR